jgi:ribonuclease HII
MPHLKLESEARRAGHLVIAGIDEVGRGPLAGPVFACAVVLVPRRVPRALIRAVDDSKLLNRERREALAAALHACAGVHIGLAEATVDEITRLNILQASKLAMVRALAALPVAADFALVDGPHVPDLPCAARAVVKGDSISASIASASIIAKVARDRHMAGLAELHPQYGWDRNAGYGTAEHLDALARHGPTLHHRPTFQPVFNMLGLKRAEDPDVGSPIHSQVIESVDS